MSVEQLRDGQLSVQSADYLGTGVIRCNWSTGASLSGVRDSLLLEEALATLRFRDIPTLGETDSPSPSGDPAPRLLNSGNLACKLRQPNGTPIRIAAAGDDHPGIGLTLEMERAGFLYGLGAAIGHPTRCDRTYTLLNRDSLFHTLPDHCYTSFPMLFARCGDSFVGAFWNSSRPVEVQTQSIDTHRRLVFRPKAGHELGQELFVFEGSYSQIFDAYTFLTGRPALPPLWALGYHQCRWSYRNEAAIRRIAKRFRRKDIPCDGLYFDIHYMDGYRVFTWNRRRFPRPRELLSDLKAAGFSPVAIVDPGIKAEPGYPVYDECLENEYFCRTGDGAPYEGVVWPGKTIFPDFTLADARAWWGKTLQRTLLRDGVIGIWNDMNEPVLLIDQPDADPLVQDLHHAGGPHWLVRNRYANLQAESTYGAMSATLDDRPFVLTRSGTSGIQRFAAVWTGDNGTSWRDLRENLNMVVNLGLSGVPFSGADVGGFANGAAFDIPKLIKIFRSFAALKLIKIRKNPELFSRWMQLGSLMPFFRVHTGLLSHAQEPWSFGDTALSNSRKHIRRRYALLPYIYQCARLAAQCGVPIVRAMFLDYPELADVHDQFMLGPDLLAAPVLEQGQTQRTVNLPRGTWTDFEIGTVYRVEQECGKITIPVTRDYYPLLVREGVLLPTANPGKNAEETMFGSLHLEVYPGEPFKKLELYTESVDRRAPPELWLEAMGNTTADDRLKLSMHIRETPVMRPRRLAVRVPAHYRLCDTPKGRIRARTKPPDEHRSCPFSEFTITQESQDMVFRGEATDRTPRSPSRSIRSP